MQTGASAGCSLGKVLECLAFAALLTVSTWADSEAQTVSERVLGKVPLKGSIGGGSVVAFQGNGFARRERVNGRERYVTVDGPGEEFDTILPGALWIQDKLVYYARQGGLTYLVIDGKKSLVVGTPTSPFAGGRFLAPNDRSHFLSFVSDGTSIRWYRDGMLQSGKFNKLTLTPIAQPAASILFVGARGCDHYVIGQKPSGAAKWDLVRWVSAVADGSIVFVYGERAGKPLLHRNGQVVLQEGIEAFERSADGKVWVAVVDRSADGIDRVELLRNGTPVSEAPVERTRQRMAVSADGSVWLWQILNDDYVGSTLRQSNRPERRIDLEVAELKLSDDGSRLAVVMRDTQNQQLLIEVDGSELEPAVALRPRSLALGPGKSYAFVRIDGEFSTVVSHLGRGPTYETVSQVLFLPDGRPVYIGSRPGVHEAVIGTTSVPLAATDVHHLNTLRLDGGNLRVLGTREDEVVDFTVSAQ